MLSIVGGTYWENCQEPVYSEIFGSGFRAALALAKCTPSRQFITCVGEDDIDVFLEKCIEHNITPAVSPISQTISFNYIHPLKTPSVKPDLCEHIDIILPPVEADSILYYGMAESTPIVKGDYVVYDPQSQIKFSDTNSKANHLAIVLNRREAINFSGEMENTNLLQIAKKLYAEENAEVIVIKDGANGALVFDGNGDCQIPVYKTTNVWPIGSGDIFSAVFAWQWILCKTPAKEAALIASQFTANYCECKKLPLPLKIKKRKPLSLITKPRKIYLAGPFFNMAERWLIDEFYETLTQFGHKVFSPFHHVGIGSSSEIVSKDLKGLKESEVVLAVLTGPDAGTLFEVGYARALRKRVIVFVQNISEDNLLMLRGSNCAITDDFSTAIYKATW